MMGDYRYEGSRFQTAAESLTLNVVSAGLAGLVVGALSEFTRGGPLWQGGIAGSVAAVTASLNKENGVCPDLQLPFGISGTTGASLARGIFAGTSIGLIFGSDFSFITIISPALMGLGIGSCPHRPPQKPNEDPKDQHTPG
jgi:hypothetical protein